MYSDLQTDHFGDIDFRMLNGRLDRDELVRQMREMKAQGDPLFHRPRRGTCSEREFECRRPS